MAENTLELVCWTKSWIGRRSPEISLTLTALDGGSPPRYGQPRFTEVVDINDNALSFSSCSTRCIFLENSPVGSLVVTVSASDVDSGLYGKISYTFFQPSEDISKTLEVNPETGEIRLRKQIDFETVLMKWTSRPLMGAASQENAPFSCK